MNSETFIFKEKTSPQGLIMIITDPDIIGKKFETKKLQLDLTKEFYEGTEKTKEEIKIRLKKAYVVHLTGKRAVALGVEIGIVDSERILIVDGVPHAEVWLG